MIQINPLQSYIDGGARAALTTPPSASLVFDLPGKAIWVKGVKLKGIDHTYTFSHDNYITLTNTPDKNNPESEDINIGVNIITLKNAIDTTYNGGTLALLQEGINTEERTWQAKILHNYINNILPTTKNLQINGTNYAIYTTEDSLPQFFAPTSLGTTGQILACTSSGLSWINQIQNTDYRVSQSSATNDNDYRIILKQGADNNPETNFVRFSEYLTFNPSTKILKINNTKVVTATDIYVGATSTANATAGLVPAATSEQQNYYLRGDGTWVNIATEMAAANTWRPIKVENTDVLGSSTDTGALSFTAGTGITLAWDATNKRIIITNSSPDVNHNTDETVRQVPKTDNVNRPLMMINGGTSAGEQINTSMFSTGIYANASTKMITANGFIKAGSSDNYVLLGGGNHKALSDFSMSHEHPYLPIAYTNENQTDDWGKNYAKTHYNSYVYNSSGREWSYWIGMHPSLTYGNILRLSHDGLVQYCHKTGGDKDSNWSSWKNIITSDNFNSYSPTLIGVGASGTWDINISGNAATATLSHYLTVQYCRDDNYPSNKGLWNTIKNGTTNAINNRVRFYTIYGSSANLGAPETYGELLEICSYNSNHWQPQLWFGAGTGGRLYYRNKEYNNDSWGAWRTVAWTSDIPTVTDYYWADVKVSTTSNAATNPTFNSVTATDKINATNYIFLNPNGDGIYLNKTSLNWHTNSGQQKDLLRFTSDGNIGIRTSSPGAQLHIYQTSGISVYGTYIQDMGNHWAQRSLVIMAPNLTKGSSPFIMIGKLDSTKNSGWIGYVHNADGSDLNRLSFGLHNVDNVLNILGTGNVGIGTTNPGCKLHVNGNSYLNGRTIINYNASNGTSTLQINAGSTSYAYALDIQSSISTGNNLVAFVMGISHGKNNQFSGLFKYVESGSTSNLFGFGFYANDFLLNIRADGNVGIGTITPTYKLHVAGDIYTTTGFKKEDSSDSYVLLGGGGHKEVSDFAKASCGVGEIKTFTKTLTLTTNWQDTGIHYTDLETGSYIIQLYTNNNQDLFWFEYFTGFMSWYSERTNDLGTDEIYLHKAGHAPNSRHIYLRTARHNGSDGRHLTLQIACDYSGGTSYTYTFKFRKLI